MDEFFSSSSSDFISTTIIAQIEIEMKITNGMKTISWGIK